ncbi:hypothetical protein CDD83_6317 [Cordyceps sp. RAO-2017]|nr:hypothetical protein CDD83_6317 [Cordyceps sp. RAO-2017]
MVAKKLPPEALPVDPVGRQQQQPRGDEPSEAVWDDALPSGTGRQDDAPAPPKPGQIPLSLGDEDDNVWEEARKHAGDGDKLQDVPDALKPGGSKNQTNPFFKRKPVPGRNDEPLDSSFSKLDLDDAGQGSNPWQAAADTSALPAPGQASLPQTQHALPDSAESDPWASGEPSARPAQPPHAAGSPALVSLPSEDEPSWEDDVRADSAKTAAQPPPATAMSDELMQDQNVWDDLGSLDRGKGKALDLAAPQQQAQLDDWNLIDADASSSPAKQPVEEEADTDEKPPLPPRTDSGRPRWVPSRQPVDGKSETYQVKNIKWHDDKSASNPRTSPILIQNKNGPCPLVALVNALTLTTPADMPDTALVQVLRSREQVSLTLLLDAVFDELMSPRRTDSEDALPDVSDLYAFLMSLHTGMNVNPRFIPTPEIVTAYKRTSLTHLHPAERGDLIPGTFENTMEMSLYATFSIPLIHGWLPSRSDAAYEALERQAASYEEVQNILFHEEELEEKLSRPDGGLSDSEAKLYQDILAIKMFLRESATQLTPWGIEVIAKAMRPGTFAILFRNDHFSTLYCHPQSTQLLSLVTDAGYGSHDEVVWESLVDVNGERTEYLSGDFRVVGAGSSAASNAAAGEQRGGGGGGGGGGEWKTVPSKRGKGRQQGDDEARPSTKHEQEDRDLALALQLQEEEEQRHREEQARRRRESILSEQYIEQQAHQPGPGLAVNRGARRGGQSSGGGAAPERERPGTNGVNTAAAGEANQQQQQQQPPRQQQVRPLIPPRRPGVNRRPDSSGEEAPPSYEQASQVPAFVPPSGHPNHPGSSPMASRQTSRTSLGGPGVGGSQVPGRPLRPIGPPGGRKRAVSPGVALGGQGRDRECVVM